MIALSTDFLLFKMASGESVPFSAEMVSVELMGDTAELFDADFVRHAASAVFHYFKRELGRQTVTVAEFAAALEKVLRGLKLAQPAAPPAPRRDAEAVARFDLSRLADESGQPCELLFFPRLRDELRQQLRQQPRVLHFRGLRPCVKQLMGTRRWTGGCRELEEDIVAFLRQCLTSELKQSDFSLVIE